jgi:VanZ family protein
MAGAEIARHRTSASPLAFLYVGLIVYASLYPFVPWRIPGNSPFAFITAPWTTWWTWFDLVSNLCGYLPLGALIFGAIVRGGGAVKSALVIAFLSGSMLSLSMEFLQNFLPHRVPSNIDLTLNSLGALTGALIGLWAHRRGLVELWQTARERWFIARSAGGLALLLLWPVGLLFPLPVPLGQGQVLARVQEAVATLVTGTSIAPWFEAWADVELDRTPLSPGGEFALIALGLLAPCLVAFSVAQSGWRRLLLVLGAAALGCLGTTLSTALNFGPEHLLAWSTPPALAALAVGMVVAAMLSVAPRRAAAGFGLIALTALATFVAQAPSDPYFADSLQAWEQGRFIRFHGAAQWVGWLWPYVAIVYLLARLGARDDAADATPPKMAE